jgi:hypothetical protein
MSTPRIDGNALTVPQLAVLMDDSPEGIFMCIDESLDLLLRSRHPGDSKLSRHLRSPTFRKEVARHRGFLDDDVTLRKLAYDLEIPEPTMCWAFFEARQRLLLAQRKASTQ